MVKSKSSRSSATAFFSLAGLCAAITGLYKFVMGRLSCIAAGDCIHKWSEMSGNEKIFMAVLLGLAALFFILGSVNAFKNAKVAGDDG